MAKERVEIKWHDAVRGEESWTMWEEFEPCRVLTVNSMGYIVDQNDDSITLAQSISHDQLLFTLTIPKGMIISINTLDIS